jgi:hypothetical protein
MKPNIPPGMRKLSILTWIAGAIMVAAIVIVCASPFLPNG